MSTIHASERRRNAVRTLMSTLAAADLGGALLVPDGDETTPGEDVGTWVRVTCTDAGDTYAGRVDTTYRATRHEVIVTAECYARAPLDRPLGAVDDVDGVAEQVAQVLRYLDLPLKDYVGDPSGATTVAGVALRFVQPPVTRRLPPVDGYQRRVVDAQYHLFSRHAG